MDHEGVFLRCLSDIHLECWVLHKWLLYELPQSYTAKKPSTSYPARWRGPIRYTCGMATSDTVDGSEILHQSVDTLSHYLQGFIDTSQVVQTPGFLNHQHVSNEKKTGCLVYIGGYTTQLNGNYNQPLSGSLLNNQYNGK